MGDSTNKGESMRFPQEKTREEVGREDGGVWGRLRDEGGDATASVTVSCRLVFGTPPPPHPFLQRPGEIISSQYGVYQSSQSTRLPSGYMSRLSVCLSVYGLFLQ